MEREIKFKAWIPKLKIWLEEVSISTADNVLGVCADYLEEAIKGKFIIMDDEIYMPNDYPEEDSREWVMSLLCGEEYYWIEAGEFELVEFTGLKDKNSKEIYEGDILDFDYPTIGFEGEDTSWSLKVVIDFQEGCFWFTGDGYTDCNWHFYNEKFREVIGNIYENPELLK